MNLLPRKNVTVTERGLHFERELYYACDPLFQAGLMMRKRGRKSLKVSVAYDPRQVDYIYLPSSDNQEVTICPLTDAAKTFLGRNLYETQSYFNQEVQNAELSRSQQIQSTAQFHAIQDHITKNALEKTSEAFENSEFTSKNKRVKGIRNNRSIEKNFERTKNKWLAEQSDGDLNLTEGDSSNQEVEESHIAPLSNADKIREVRRQKRGGKK